MNVQFICIISYSEKMSVMGIDKIIIGTHMRPEMWRKDFLRTPEESMVEGMSHFIQLASEYGITVLLQNSSHRFIHPHFWQSQWKYLLFIVY